MGKVQESDFKLRARSYWQACELQEPEIRKSVFVLCLPPDLHDLLTAFLRHPFQFFCLSRLALFTCELEVPVTVLCGISSQDPNKNS